MAKFKVGDKVVGNRLASEKYNITKSGWVGTVTEIRDGSVDDIVVIGSYMDYGECGFPVCSKYFDLVERDGVPYTSMTVGNFTLMAPIFSGPGFGDDVGGMSIVPKRILKSGDRTIVFWDDGTKTIVKRAEDEADNDYAAFTAAFAIKQFGSNSALKRVIEQKTERQGKKKPEHKPMDKIGGDVKFPDSAIEEIIEGLASVGAITIDELAKRATELAKSVGKRIEIDRGIVVKEEDDQ